ncbi:MAG TPA: hypothetical protein VGZ00_11185 [Candidatus Baltobacteraceae bacterium]|jgi:hypothetical protein|nr:hypothetical protein [Candidatus Baltobacteraceae bacterium]
MSTQSGVTKIPNETFNWISWERDTHGNDPRAWKSKPSPSQWEEVEALLEALRRQATAVDFAKSPAFKGYLSKPPGREWSEEFLRERAREIAFLQRPVAKTSVRAKILNIFKRAQRDARAMMDGTLPLTEAIVDRFEEKSLTAPSSAFLSVLKSKPCAAHLMELGKHGDRYTLELSEGQRDPEIRKTVSGVLSEVSMVQNLERGRKKLEAEEARRHHVAVGTNVIENMRDEFKNNRHKEPPTQNRNAPPRSPSP